MGDFWPSGPDPVEAGLDLGLALENIPKALLPVVVTSDYLEVVIGVRVVNGLVRDAAMFLLGQLFLLAVLDHVFGHSLLPPLRAGGGSHEPCADQLPDCEFELHQGIEGFREPALVKL